MTDLPTIDLRHGHGLPIYTMHALHSGWISYLTDISDGAPEIAAAHIARTKGTHFDTWLYAVAHDHLYAIVVSRDEDGELQMSLALTTTEGHDRRMFTMPGRHGGLDDDWLTYAMQLGFREELELLLDEPPTDGLENA